MSSEKIFLIFIILVVGAFILWYNTSYSYNDKDEDDIEREEIIKEYENLEKIEKLESSKKSNRDSFTTSSKSVLNRINVPKHINKHNSPIATTIRQPSQPITVNPVNPVNAVDRAVSRFKRPLSNPAQHVPHSAGPMV